MPAQLDAFSTLLDQVGSSLGLFQKMRDELPDREWEAMCDHPLIGPLLDSLSDLEYTLGD